MANHIFAKFKTKSFTSKILLEEIQLINEKRFEGILKVSLYQTNVPSSGIVVSLPSCQDDGLESIDFWLATKRTIETRHTHYRHWSWIQDVIINELAHKYNGMISDEGVPETWRGKSGKFKKFKDYCALFYQFSYKFYLEENDIKHSKEVKSDFLESVYDRYEAINLPKEIMMLGIPKNLRILV